ncbi:hypothetical protein, partial [Escherichia coli]|uniref:hypothetical protein n=1 Tax=Escherichia coli TaxID=562 RepID=UPI0010F8DD8A
MDNPNLDFDPEADKNPKPEVSPELESILKSLNNLTVVATRIASDVRNSKNGNNSNNQTPSKKNQKKPKKDGQGKPEKKPQAEAEEKRREENER